MQANTLTRRLFDSLNDRLNAELDGQRDFGIVRRLADATDYLWERVCRCDDVPSYYKN